MASITGIILPTSFADNTKFAKIGQASGGDSTGNTLDALPMNILVNVENVGGDSNKAADPFTMGNSFISMYTQRIFDSVLGVYVYYRLPDITYSPNPTQTSPNHSGVSNLVASRHEIVNISQEIG